MERLQEVHELTQHLRFAILLVLENSGCTCCGLGTIKSSSAVGGLTSHGEGVPPVPPSHDRMAATTMEGKPMGKSPSRISDLPRSLPSLKFHSSCVIFWLRPARNIELNSIELAELTKLPSTQVSGDLKNMGMECLKFLHWENETSKFSFLFWGPSSLTAKSESAMICLSKFVTNSLGTTRTTRTTPEVASFHQDPRHPKVHLPLA